MNTVQLSCLGDRLERKWLSATVKKQGITAGPGVNHLGRCQGGCSRKDPVTERQQLWERRGQNDPGNTTFGTRRHTMETQEGKGTALSRF